MAVTPAKIKSRLLKSLSELALQVAPANYTKIIPTSALHWINS